MVIGFVFIHGWGFDSSFSTPLAKAFKGIPQINIDLGYFSKIADGDNPVDIKKSLDFFEAHHEQNGDIKWVGVGHSFGFHKLLDSSLLGKLKGLISISGFTRFCNHKQNQPGTNLKIIDRMIAGFENSPQTVLENFWQKCKVELVPPLTYTNAPRLLRDLKLMREMDFTKELESLGEKNVPVLNIYGSDDTIVSKDLSLDCFKDYKNITNIEFSSAFHNLGYKSAERIAGHIKLWLGAEEIE